MSLARALSMLSDDAHTARVLRDVLSLFRHHKAEWLSEADVRTKTGQPPADVGAILPVLSRAFVLDFDSESERYRYHGDAVLGYEIETFMRRVDTHDTHIQTNVARFRDRYGA